MDENATVLREIRPFPLIVAAAVALAVAILADNLVLLNHGRIVFFSTFMILIASYSAQDGMKRTPMLVFLALYVLAHAGLVLVPIEDGDYYGAILIPLVILDYIGMAYSLQFVWQRTGPQ